MRKITFPRAGSFEHRVLTGLGGNQFAELLIELAHPWEVQVEGLREARRGDGGSRGGGRHHELVFANRLAVTLTHLRHGWTFDALAALFGVNRATVGRAVNEVRPLLVARGVEVEAGVRLHTLADAFAWRSQGSSATAPQPDGPGVLAGARTG